ncbi:secondary thiamine-phosphate synthase enzyme YjbQ [Acidithiobacillus sp. M4-SHS-6]|uniref:secondary thiamine-phosphate synthase enzyme YjbQ n=1 Tax=Acidithiobacillus sp. M4-SHS-6 TaxID=3383024 RepID=UPI0039BDF428
MKHLSTEWKIAAGGRRLQELTGALQSWLQAVAAREGLVNLFVPHTSASLVLQENADPDVQQDILDYFARLVPDDDPHFRHRNEGPDDMSAHLRCVLTQNSLVIPVREGRAALGVWQGVFLFEHRTRSLTRQVLVSFQGETGEK